MSRLRQVLLRLYYVLRPGRAESDLAREIEAHLQLLEDELCGQGLTPEAARLAARRRFGGVEQTKELHRDARSFVWLDGVRRDVRYALQSLRRTPGFTAVVVTTLALGIGANAAIFSVTDAVLLHPVPVEHQEDVVVIYRALTDQTPYRGVSFPLYRAIAEHTRSVTGVAAFEARQTVVRTGTANDQLLTGLVSGNYFSLLALRPQVGRLLAPVDDDVPGAHTVVVLSDALWTRAFNRNPGVVNSTIGIGGTSFTVVGVAPRGFHGTDLSSTIDLWVPATMLADVGLGGFFAPERRLLLFSDRRFHFWNLIARVRPGWGPGLTAELNAVFADDQRQHPSPKPSQDGYPGHDVLLNAMSATPLVEATALNERQTLVRFVAILMTVVGLTLAIACFNVANLLAVRAGERAPELSVRASLGASRARIVQQLVLEGMLLALGAAAVGTLLDMLIVRLLSAFTLPGNIALASLSLMPNPRILAFTAALSLLTVLLFGLLPSVGASQMDLTSALRSRGVRRHPMRAWLVVNEVAMSFLLLVGAALFVRTVRAGLAADIGFDPKPLAAVTTNPSLAGFSTTDPGQYFAEALEDAARIPGVTGAALASHLPLAAIDDVRPFIAGRKTTQNQVEVTAGFSAVSTNYFDMLGVPLLVGRAFTVADDPAAASVAILNEAASRLLFPDGRPLGRQITHANMLHYTIVGVVRDTKYESIRDDHRPMVFVPFAQAAGGNVSVIVRASDPAAALASLQRELRTLPPYPPLRNPRLVAGQTDAALMPQRFGATLLGVYALVALSIAAVGIYGVVSYSVNRLKRDIGIRIALGARPASVFWLVTSRVAVAIACGLVTGLAGAG